MPRKKKTPVTFDEWLGKVIDDETEHRGGRDAVAEWIGSSKQSVNRRMRGELPFFAREVQIIAARTGISAGEMLSRALRDYGGLQKLIAEYGMSEGVISLDAHRKKVDPATTPDEELREELNAAGFDPELLEDEKFE